MSTVAVIILVIAGALVLLAIGGMIARQRVTEANRRSFEESLERVNHDLAEAHAQDRGWERSGLEAAARHALAEQRPGLEPEQMTLVQVVDRPGTDEDKAVFRVDVGSERMLLTLGRRDGAWTFEQLG